MTVKLTFFGNFFQTATFFLGCFGPGEKVSKEVTAGIILVCCKLGQHIFQIFVAPESVCFCSFYQAVHDGAGFCSADGIYVDPVLPLEGEGTDGAFCGIVVHGNFPISQEEPKIFLLVQTVLERLVSTASSGDFWKRFFYPSEISVNFWRDLTLTVIFLVFIFGFIAKPVQVEQLGDQLHTLCGNGSFEFLIPVAFTSSAYFRFACALFENWNKVHIRRYFVDAIPKGKQPDYNQQAVQGVHYCDRLAKLESSISGKCGTDYEKRKQMRLEKEKPVLEAFWAWVDSQKPVRNTRLDKALTYVKTAEKHP